MDDLSRGSAIRLQDLQNRIEFMEADVRDAEAVSRAVRGVDRVCHLAFINGTALFYQKPETVLEVGVKGMLNVLEACRAQRVRELILVSSSEVYQNPPRIPTDEATPLSIPDPLNPRYSYAAGKILSEMLAINYGRTGFDRVLIVRPHNVYGPDMGWEHVIPQCVLRMRQLCREPANPIRFPLQGTGQETRAFVYLDDFIDGLLLVLERGKHLGIYHIGMNEEITIRAVAEAIGRYFSRAVTIVPGEPAPGSPTRRCPNISKMQQLGYDPKVRFSDGLPRVARWYDQHADEHPATSNTDPRIAVPSRG